MNELQHETKAQFIFKEKRKWQIALRRYVLEKKANSFYAPYFALDIKSFRQWIEVQFTDDLNWSNFSSQWQFDHIIPVAYFDLASESDLKLCWNFSNIRVEKCDLNKNRGNHIDVVAAKSYFEVLYNETGYAICRGMIEKISRIEVSQIASNTVLKAFINQKKEFINQLSDFSSYEYMRLNEGSSVEDILSEREFLKRFSS